MLSNVRCFYLQQTVDTNFKFLFVFTFEWSFFGFGWVKGRKTTQFGSGTKSCCAL